MRRTAAILLTTACILGLTTTTATADGTPAAAPASGVVDLPTVAGYVIQTVTALGGLR
ncbi:MULTISPECIES: hypothetical protein [unclassified Streptomyces]|uniref:hypothetical protein n=1 Tax=unclassified Streptomyces TaxID=2593676 RepID=UPI00381FF7F3